MQDLNTGFERILLEPPQRELLATLVDARRSLPVAGRQKFNSTLTREGNFILHPGLPRGQELVYEGDLEALHNEGLISLSRTDAYSSEFDVTPLGLEYYAWLNTHEGQPVEHVEGEVMGYLKRERFREKYPGAYDKWACADALIWGSESEQHLTTIGHLCREAMQEFATALVRLYHPPDVDPDETHVRNRVRQVLELGKGTIGKAERVLLDSIMGYWEAVDGLVQRQEHDSRKEGQPLVWEDGRRLVFQLAVVMFEIDRVAQGGQNGRRFS